DPLFQLLPKKQLLQLKKQYHPLIKFLPPIPHIKSIPQPLFLLHPPKHPNPIAEPPKLNIPILPILHTNCHPDQIDYLIPANHDA
ncbi:30S ribosomal protein S2, partial [Staphylococcus aureus]|uniref:30S ribosomal protein S2 n=1 Tax=Staphylococcus aureus TaxID=1280 RepID=UPI0011A92CD8